MNEQLTEEKAWCKVTGFFHCRNAEIWRKNLKFKELNIGAELLGAIEEMGFEEATPIQAQAIPIALEGHDVIGQAQTGTGKTVAFGIPMIENINANEAKIQALIIAPTRELAVQTQDEVHRLGKNQGIKSVSIYGGTNIQKQIQHLKRNPHVVVGTPGRLLDLIRRRVLKLQDVHTLVLDEADEMLNMGFIEDIRAIIQEVPQERQTLLFSATMPNAVRDIGVRFMKNPKTVSVKAERLTADSVTQHYTRVQGNEKFDALTRMLLVNQPDAAIVFGRTKRRVDEVTRGLKERGFDAEGIHGDLPQKSRMRVLRDFKDGRLRILVATDVAARGLDISHVTHVYNYDIPQDAESYVHRIGRTGRAGEKGHSHTFVASNEMEYLKMIERTTGLQMTPYAPPTREELIHQQLDAVVKKAGKSLEGIKAEQFTDVVKEMTESYTPEELALLVAHSLVEDPTAIPVNITAERPLPSRGKGGKGGKGRGGRRGGNQNRRGGNRNKGNSGRRQNKSNDGGNSESGRQKGKRTNFTSRKRSR